MSYETKLLPLMPLETIKRSEKLTLYDSVDDDVLQSYTEYALAQLIYYTMKESATSEQSSRMTAMDGASKNAGELLPVTAVRCLALAVFRSLWKLLQAK